MTFARLLSFTLLVASLGVSQAQTAPAQTAPAQTTPAQTAPTQTTLVAFSDARLPFSISAPGNWLGINLGDGANGLSIVSARTSPATMIRLLFAGKDTGEKINLTVEADNYEEDLKATKLTVRRLSSKEATYGGLRGVEREYQLVGGQTEVRMRVWFADNAGHLFSFQLTDTAPRYAAASELFSRMLATVKFR